MSFENLADSLGVRPDRSELLELMYVERDGSQQEISRYRNSLLTESYKLDPQLLELDLDSITFTKLYNATSKVSSNSGVDGNSSRSTTVDKIPTHRLS